MAVTVGTTSVDAQTLMISLKGTIDQVRKTLANGTLAQTWYQWSGRKEDIITFAGSGTAWSVIYVVSKP